MMKFLLYCVVTTALLVGNCLGAFNPVNLFLTATISPDNEKLTKGTHCSWDGSDSSSIKIVLNINENSQDFRVFNDDGNGAPGPMVEYECRLLSVFELDTNNDNIEATCATGNTFIRQGVTTPSTAIQIAQYRTQELSFTIDGTVTDGVIPCGGILGNSGTEVGYLAVCRRDFSYQHWSDINVYYKLDLTKCINTQLDSDNIQVDDISNTALTRNYDVTFNLYESDYETRAAMDASFITGNYMKTPYGSVSSVPLGSVIYFEGCISTNDERLQYFVEGQSVMGLSFRNCVAAPITVGDAVLSGVPNSVQVSDANGCGLGASPVKQWATDEYVFQYGLGGQVADKPHLQSPNCFRSDLFEAVSFARTHAGLASTVIFSCDVVYCFNSDNGYCFGDPYPSCPSSKRKRRSDVPDYLPQKVSLNFTIVPPPMDAEPVVAKECFNKPTFFTLLAVLLTLFFLFMSADVFLGVQLRKKGSKVNRSDRGSETISSAPTSQKIFI